MLILPTRTTPPCKGTLSAIDSLGSISVLMHAYPTEIEKNVSIHVTLKILIGMVMRVTQVLSPAEAATVEVGCRL